MNAYQQKVMQGIARHFGISKKFIVPMVEESLKNNNQVFFDLRGNGEEDSLEHLNDFKYKKIYASKEKEVNISKLWSYSKLTTTPLWANYNDMASNEGGDILFCYIHGADVFVVHEQEEYRGLGGIFTKESHNSVGLAIESLKNYLEYYYPVERGE